MGNDHAHIERERAVPNERGRHGKCEVATRALVGGHIAPEYSTNRERRDLLRRAHHAHHARRWGPLGLCLLGRGALVILRHHRVGRVAAPLAARCAKDLGLLGGLGKRFGEVVLQHGPAARELALRAGEGGTRRGVAQAGVVRAWGRVDQCVAGGGQREEVACGAGAARERKEKGESKGQRGRARAARGVRG